MIPAMAERRRLMEKNGLNQNNSYQESFKKTTVHSLIKTIFMIIVHDIFICKPGNASKLAKKFKDAMAGNDELVSIMTDLSGQFNKVVMVTKYESLGAFEQNFEKYKQNSEAMKKMTEAMAGYQDMYLTGSREIYQSW